MDDEYSTIDAIFGVSGVASNKKLCLFAIWWSANACAYAHQIIYSLSLHYIFLRIFQTVFVSMYDAVG